MKRLLFSSLLLIFLPLFAYATTDNNSPIFSQYWCGPDAGCSGQSTDFSDIHPATTHVFVAFGLVDSQGNVTFQLDQGFSPAAFIQDIQQLQASGKKVLLSIGGQGANWDGALNHPATFVNTLSSLLSTYSFDGVDLDIEGPSLASQTQSAQLTALIASLRTQFDKVTKEHLLITVTPECTTVVNTIGTIGGGWNTMVPVVNDAINNIDFIQVQAYNDNPYGDQPATLPFFSNIYNNWVAPFSLGTAQYHGMPASKLVMGILASTSAGGSSFYAAPDVISNTISTLKTTHADFGGVMIWDSHWDVVNQQVIGNAVAQALGLRE